MTVRLTEEGWRVFQRALADARRASLDVPHLEHLLLALLDEAPVIATLTAFGADPPAIAQQARDYLASGAPYDLGPSWLRWLRWLFQGVSPGYPFHVEAVRQRALHYASGRGGEQADALDVLAALLIVAHPILPDAREGAAVEGSYRGRAASPIHPLIALRRQDVTTAAVLRRLAHGETPSEPAAPPCFAPRDPVEVVVHNDHYTSAWFVREQLRLRFGLSWWQSVRVTTLVHRTGQGVAARLPFEQANAACLDVREAAERRGYPLKLTLRPAR